jgi:integrase
VRRGPSSSTITHPISLQANACSIKTGNLKAVPKILGHASIQTTPDIYRDWDIDQLAERLAEVLLENDD